MRPFNLINTSKAAGCELSRFEVHKIMEKCSKSKSHITKDEFLKIMTRSNMNDDLKGRKPSEKTDPKDETENEIEAHITIPKIFPEDEQPTLSNLTKSTAAMSSTFTVGSTTGRSLRTRTERE